MKKYLAIVFSLIALVGVGSPTRSSVGACHSKFSPAEEKLDNPYVTDGLVAMWDGIWNAGLGRHDGQAMIWRDLVNGQDLFVSRGVWGDNGLYGSASAACEAIFSDSSYSLKSIVSATASTTVGCTVEYGCTPFGYGNTPYDLYGSWRIYTIGSSSPWTWYRCNSWVLNVSSVGELMVPISFSGVSTPRIPYPNIKLFINGEFLSQGAYTPHTDSVTDVFTVGLKGCVHYLRIYSRALTEEEIAWNFAVDQARFGL